MHTVYLVMVEWDYANGTTASDVLSAHSERASAQRDIDNCRRVDAESGPDSTSTHYWIRVMAVTYVPSDD